MFHPAAVLTFFLAALFLVPANAQDVGSLELAGRVKIGTKVEKIKRKRFFLFRGGLESNRALIDRMKAAAVTSRDCFYCQMKASPEFVAWLKAEDCESPFCREVTAEDTKSVPEFSAAFKKGLTQYRNKADIAQKWITTNLAPGLRDGYYLQRKAAAETVLQAVRPLQSSMTDSVSVRAMFIDIPLNLGGKTTETFLISNVVPIEISGKSYLWSCEVEIGPTKKVLLPLQVPEPNKTVKKCEVTVRDLPACTAGACGAR
jgi:hypothetical protein